MTGLKYQKVLPLRSEPWSKWRMLIETGSACLGRDLVSPASHLFRHGNLIDFHLSHILFKTEGGREFMSCHML